MKIVVTAREVFQNYNWEKFCEIIGLNYYCLNDGMDGDREFTLTVSQAMQIGVNLDKNIPNDNNNIYYCRCGRLTECPGHDCIHCLNNR